jgi:hypothetical protein
MNLLRLRKHKSFKKINKDRKNNSIITNFNKTARSNLVIKVKKNKNIRQTLINTFKINSFFSWIKIHLKEIGKTMI